MLYGKKKVVVQVSEKGDKILIWRNNVYDTSVRTGCELALYPGSQWAHKESGYEARCEI